MYTGKYIGTVDLFRQNWRVMAGLVAVTTATVWAHEELFDAYLRISLAVAALGTAISFFIGFLTSQAYDRWWEARKIWGEVVNDSRSFGRLVATVLPRVPELDPLRDRLVRRHIAFLYALKARLREEAPDECRAMLPDEDVARIGEQRHLPNALLQLQGEDVDAVQRDAHIDVIRMAQINEMLNRFSTSMGAAERIKLTVFPAFYPSMIRLSIWGYVIVFALALSEEMGYGALPFVFLAGTVFHLVYAAGQLLVDPFENGPADIPMSSIVRNIEINLLEQIGEKVLPPPVEPVDGRYLM